MPHCPWVITVTAVRYTTTRHELTHRRCDDLHVLYHNGSGDTHVLDDLTYVALEMLRDQVDDIDGLTQRVAEAFDASVDSTLREKVVGLVERLEQLALIEPSRGLEPTF